MQRGQMRLKAFFAGRLCHVGAPAAPPSAPALGRWPGGALPGMPSGAPLPPLAQAPLAPVFWRKWRRSG